jgi:hypothetical protein
MLIKLLFYLQADDGIFLCYIFIFYIWRPVDLPLLLAWVQLCAERDWQVVFNWRFDNFVTYSIILSSLSVLIIQKEDIGVLGSPFPYFTYKT